MIIRSALKGFFDEWRSASDEAKELLRKGRDLMTSPQNSLNSLYPVKKTRNERLK